MSEADIEYLNDLINLAKILPNGECRILDKEIEAIEHLLQAYKEQQQVIDEAIIYIKEKQKIQYEYALSQIECDYLIRNKIKEIEKIDRTYDECWNTQLEILKELSGE